MSNEESPSKCAGFTNFLYNKNEGTVLGRTGKSWALILVFYTIYYVCLAGFFTSMLIVFLKFTVPATQPSLTGHQSLLKMSPGMGFRPQPDVRSTLIRFDPSKPKSYKDYVKHLTETFEKHNNMTDEVRKQVFNNGPCIDSSAAFAQANLENYKNGKVCGFPLSTLGANCQAKDKFGYPNGKPCVLVHLNKVFGWLPETISAQYNDVHIKCVGENPADHENLGRVMYTPGATVRTNVTDETGAVRVESSSVGVIYNSYFPFMAQKAYRTPLIALTFPDIKPQTLVMVQCRISNVVNMQFDRTLRLGMTRFEIFVDSKASVVA